jgi:hypothetical protein
MRRAAIASFVLCITSPFAAADCPKVGESEWCCTVAQRAAEVDFADGGYGWRPKSKFCEGLYSEPNSGGGILTVVGLVARPVPTSAQLATGELEISVPVLPAAVKGPVRFFGSSLVSSRYLIAGDFATPTPKKWDPRLFIKKGLTIGNFDFYAFVPPDAPTRGTVYVPLRLTPSGSSASGDRSVRLRLISSQNLLSVRAYYHALTAEFRPDRHAAPVQLSADVINRRQIVIQIPGNVPAIFRVYVGACSPVDTCDPSVADDGKFDIVALQ